MSANNIDQQTAENILKSISIPPCPGVVMALLEEARQPEVNFNKLVKLISGDVSLAAAMMKSANSPFFALRNKVTSVQQAVSVLGLKNLIQIVTGLALRKSAGNAVSMERFWDRSNYTAAASSKITGWLRRHDVTRDDAYTHGLFHDCGIPVLMQRFPDYKEVLVAANSSAELVIKVEDEHYSTNHAVVGNMMAKAWFLPAHIAEAIRLHHDFGIFQEANDDAAVKTLVAITQVAEHVVSTFLGFPDDAEWLAAKEIVQEYLDIDDDELQDMRDDLISELEEIQSYRG